MSAIDRIKRTAAMRAYDFVDKDTEQNIPKLIDKYIDLDDLHAVSGMATHIRDNFNRPHERLQPALHWLLGGGVRP